MKRNRDLVILSASLRAPKCQKSGSHGEKMVRLRTFDPKLGKDKGISDFETGFICKNRPNNVDNDDEINSFKDFIYYRHVNELDFEWPMRANMRAEFIQWNGGKRNPPKFIALPGPWYSEQKLTAFKTWVGEKGMEYEGYMTLAD